MVQFRRQAVFGQSYENCSWDLQSEAVFVSEEYERFCVLFWVDL